MSDASESNRAPVDRQPQDRPPGGPVKPKIGDSRPAPTPARRPADGGQNNQNNQNTQNKQNAQNKQSQGGGDGGGGQEPGSGGNRRRRRRRKKPSDGQSQSGGNQSQRGGQNRSDGGNNKSGGGQSKGSGSGRRRNRGRGGNKPDPVSPVVADGPIDLSEENLKKRQGRSRKGRPVGRYLMVVSKKADATHIAVLEGRTLIEYYVSRPADNVFQIHGNIYLGRVQNVLPGMEAAFVDIGTPKNAVIYRGDVQYSKDDFDGKAGRSGGQGPKIEQMLKARQTILCQVTKNPIAHKGARLTTEVSLPGRFVVLVPNSDTYGISKRLPDDERKRLRQILDKARPKGHGLIVRTAAENVTGPEIERDIAGLMEQWTEIQKRAKQIKAPALLYQEPDMSTRIVREEFNKEYRGVVLDDQGLYDEVADYVGTITPALADRVEFYDPDKEPLSLFERYHVHEQLHKALDRKVWLPSGGSLVIESTEALTVIDVNTGKNVGSSSLEDTVFRNNLEAAEGIAHQLRLRDIGGIIVIDFVDMESKKNRDEVMRVFRSALSRDKTRTQVFDISDLGLAEMTRKRIGEGLVESLSEDCPHCEGRGLQMLEQD